MNKNREIVLSS